MPSREIALQDYFFPLDNRGLSQMTSAPKRGVSEMLTKPDMGEGGLTNDDVSKKGHFAAIKQIQKQEYPTFEFVFQ